MSDVRNWQGEFLEEEIALWVAPSTSGAPLLGIADSGSSQVTVQPDAWGRFLLAHVPARIICHNVARLHWAIHDHLHKQGDEQGLKLLWWFSRRCRFRDVQLLDQRLRLTEGRYPSPHSLAEMARDYYGLELPDPNEIRPRVEAGSDAGLSGGDWDRACETTRGIRAIDRALMERAEGIVRDLTILPKITRRFGVLGGGVDVRGAIALEAARRNGIAITPASAAELERAGQASYRECCAQLSADRDAKACFKWSSDGLVRVDRKGFLKIHEERLRKWLLKVLDSIRDVHNDLLSPPLDNQGHISVNPEHWGMLPRFDPRLDAWARMAAATAVEQWLRPDNNWEFHPTYGVVPRIHSAKPSLSQVRQFGHPFRPRSGHVYIVGQLDDLELRCWAHLCERRYHPLGVLIARMYRRGEDPVLATAAELSMQTNELNERFPRLKRLRNAKLGTHEYWVAIARSLLRWVPRNIATIHLRKILREELQDLDLGETEALVLLDILVHEVHREMPAFLFEAPMYDIAGMDGLKATTAFPTPFPVTLAGRLGRRVYANESRVSEYLDMADEVMQTVAYELVTAGHRLVAVDGEEFVVEVPEGRHIDLDAVKEVVTKAAKPLLADIASGCCKCRLEEKW